MHLIITYDFENCGKLFDGTTALFNSFELDIVMRYVLHIHIHMQN